MERFLLILCILVVTCKGSSSNSPLIRNVWRGGDHLEGPHWSVAEQALYYVDISDQKIHRLDTATNNVTTRDIGYGPVTPVVTIRDYPGMVLTCVHTELFIVPWDAPAGDSNMRLLTAIDLGLPDNRCNDGKADARGRLWLGTMGAEVNENVDEDQGSLYLVTNVNYLNPAVKVRPVSVSNGITWTKDSKFMFYIDSPTKNIDVFDFELETGGIKNRRTLFSFQANNVTGVPDGMTIDSDGHLWIACYNGAKVIKVDSRSGKLLEQHNLPATKVTSVMWGGDDLSSLYVTTSKRGLTAAELAQQPEAGSLFAIEGTGSKGLPENQFVFEEAASY